PSHLSPGTRLATPYRSSISLHDALPIWGAPYRHFTGKDSLLDAVATESWERLGNQMHALRTDPALPASEKLRGALRSLIGVGREDRKSTRLNSSHVKNSYAVFCLKIINI